MAVEHATLRSWLAGGVLVLAALLAGSGARAQSPGAYDLRGAEFHVPPGWEVTWSRRDEEYDFASPDRRFQLWARWWFPDEPLLGFDDVVQHATRFLAGQEALVIHTETAQERKLTVAFPRLDTEGEQFLWQLIAAPSVPLAEQQAQFEALLAGLSLDGQPALGATGPSAGAGHPPVPPAPMVPVPPPPVIEGGAPQGTLAPSVPPPGGKSPTSAVVPPVGLMPVPPSPP